jgi:integrating conjugative element protein (TIGR03746 family)
VARFINELHNKESLIKIQWVFIAILALALLVAIWGLQSAPKTMTLHIPPDLRSGAKLRPGDTPPPNVYAFAHYIWQQLNRWPTDGSKDYGDAIYRLQAFMTTSCRRELERDLAVKADSGELSLRTRSMQEIPGRGYDDTRVVPLGNNAWRTSIDFEILETLRGMSVKKANVNYPLRVVRFDADPERNPFGLAIDCFNDDERPTRIEISPDPAGTQAQTKPSTQAAATGANR